VRGRDDRVTPSAADLSARLDKWLWAVRLFKSRALATDACRAGSVTVNELPAKPARDVHGGELVQVRQASSRVRFGLSVCRARASARSSSLNSARISRRLQSGTK